MTFFNFLTLLPFFTSMLGEPNYAQIIEADRQLNRLIATHQVDAAAQFYVDDFVLTTSSGAVKKKKDMLDEIGLADLQFEINETTQVQVRLVENTAILTGTLHQKGMYKQKPFDHKLLVTDTWIWVQGRWKLLAGHATILTPSLNN